MTNVLTVDQSRLLVSVPDFVSFLVLVITAIGVWFAYKEFRHNRSRNSIDKAFELSRIYESSILPLISLYTEVLTISNLSSKYLQPLSEKVTLEFSADEMFELFYSGIVEEYESDLKNVDTDHIFQVRMTCNAMDISSPTESTALFKGYQEYGLAKAQKDTVLIDFYSMVSHNDFKVLLSKLVNTLEWFSMCLCSELAEEKAVYQSLHQTFLSCVGHLYVYISKKNTSSHNKYFTNIIALYNCWSTRQNAQVAKEENAKRVYLNKKRQATVPPMKVKK